nr:hypothetical protein [Tanacetum cinerariifolium]
MVLVVEQIDHPSRSGFIKSSVLTRKFKRYSFFETPKVLLLAWDVVSKIKDAFGNKQYKPKDMQELFRKLFNVVQNIHEELAEYINTLSWNRLAFYNNGKDDDEDYTIAITPDFPITDSLSIGDEHLSPISETESDELINLVLRTLSQTQVSSRIYLILKEIYSNPLFDEEIISIKTDPHHFNAESDLIEYFLNQGSLIFSYPKFDSFLEEFSGELAHIDLIPPGINEAEFDPEEDIYFVERLFDYSDSEGDNLFLERLLHDDPIPLPDTLDFKCRPSFSSLLHLSGDFFNSSLLRE